MPRARVEQRRAGRIERPATNPSPTPLRSGVTAPPKRMSRAASSGRDSPPSTYVWYASFGSNILLERFECYLRGGRIGGMVRDMPGSRDPTPPVASSLWMDVPYRLFFAHSSPTWAGGGVAFVDVTSLSPTLPTAFRLYRITLEQFNDVLAQENGMEPGAAGCRELTGDDAARLVRHWRTEASSLAATGPDEVMHAGTTGTTGPPAESRAPSELWYGYVKCVGVKDGEPVLTFTCDADELRGFRSGDIPTNPPCEAYVDVIARGLVQCGLGDEEAREYLEDRVEASMTSDAGAAAV